MFAKDAVTKLNFKVQVTRWFVKIPSPIFQAKKIPTWSGELPPHWLPSLCWRSQHQQQLQETEKKVNQSNLFLFTIFLVSQCVCFERYGDIFSLYVGRTPVVVLNTFELIKTTFDRWTHTKVHKAKKTLKTWAHVSIKMFRAEYSGRPGNFSGTFFQKGKTGGWWWLYGTIEIVFIVRNGAVKMLLGRITQYTWTDPTVKYNPFPIQIIQWKVSMIL